MYKNLALVVLLQEVAAKGGAMTTPTTNTDETVVQSPDTIVSSDKTDTDLGPPTYPG